MEYRKDIQILRGVAVLLVVFYHLGVAGFDSGFLGVDVFFVVSGYLMAVLYDPGNKRNFYVRRSIRLLPAYFITIFIVIILSVAIVTPNEYRQVSTQSMYASLFSSNIGFFKGNIVTSAA